MASQVAIIHGWSDESKSFRALRDYLGAHGYDVKQIWLGDYVSLDDDVRVEDVAKRMQRVLLASVKNGDLTPPFDVIIHSTGGLVVREWLASFYPDGMSGAAGKCPVRRIVMLAPANFGSRLASLGKSMIGRIAKGWNNWFQTGEQMLHALELASPYAWRLARRDVLSPTGDDAPGPYGHGGKVWPFVLIGTRPYPEGLRQIVNESGSDGTVRVAAANLNVVGMTVDFATDPGKPGITRWGSRLGNARVPFAVLPERDHGTVIHPEQDSDSTDGQLLGRLIREALQCNSDADYDRIAKAWDELSESTAKLATTDAQRKAMFRGKTPERELFHQYMQVVVVVRDDHGQPVDDYFLEFFAEGEKGVDDSVTFHKQVLEHVHTNTRQPSHRCLFLDRTDLLKLFYEKIKDPNKRNVSMSLSAAPIGKNVRYFDSTKEGAKGHVVVHSESLEEREELPARLCRNSTHLVEIIIPREPVDKVFKLSR